MVNSDSLNKKLKDLEKELDNYDPKVLRKMILDLHRQSHKSASPNYCEVQAKKIFENLQSYMPSGIYRELIKIILLHEDKLNS